MMIIANLVGFCVGTEGIQTLLSQIFNRDGLMFVLLVFLTIFSAVMLMFEVREEEKRRGVNKKY